MNTYRIHINGQEYTVAIDDLDVSPIRVTVNGKPFDVTIDPQGTQATAQPARSAAPVAPSEDLMLDTYVPTVASTYIEVALEPESTDAGPSAAQVPSEGAETVTAPMPGTVLDIAVKIGDVVEQGDTLCNLEAMKMKSPIRSPSKGTVEQILISEGQNVAFGEALFTLG